MLVLKATGYSQNYAGIIAAPLDGFTLSIQNTAAGNLEHAEMVENRQGCMI